MLRTLAIMAVALFSVFRLGFALQRIEPAQVFMRGPTCALVGARLLDDGATCSFNAAIAGRLDGNFQVTPVGQPDRQFFASSSNLTYSYSRDAWRLAFGAQYWLPILFLIFVLSWPVLSTRNLLTRRDRQSFGQ